jgi:SAM-dependent methyltransferase
VLPYTKQADRQITIGETVIDCFTAGAHNIDAVTVASFGEEWTKFSHFSDAEISAIGAEYFDIVPPAALNEGSVVLDAGCGTGRWSLYAAKRAKFVEAIDPSQAVLAAAKLTAGAGNIRVTQSAIDTLPFADASFDFVFSLGVLHHIPDTFAALKALVQKVKPGGYFLVYLYYNLDNRGVAYKALFGAVNQLRIAVSKLPGAAKRLVCDALAVALYLPLVSAAWVFKQLTPGSNAYQKIPLAYYVGKSWKVIRNDALDRFGTPLEQRFSRQQVHDMMTRAGLENIVFSEGAPYWHALGRKPL